jgi:hypothetical protein
MDGWSNSQLLGEVLQRYSGAPRPMAAAYRDYIAWLQRQDARRAGLLARAAGRAARADPTGSRHYRRRATAATATIT